MHAEKGRALTGGAYRHQAGTCGNRILRLYQPGQRLDRWRLEQCRQRKGAAELSVNALKVLRFLQTREWEVCRLLRLSQTSHTEVERTMNRYITYHLERKLKSVDFVHRLRSQAGMT